MRVCDSRIVEVTTYARGALITRELLVPETPASGLLELRVDGLTPTLWPGSLRARAESPNTRILAARSRLEVPQQNERSGLELQLNEAVRRHNEVQRRLEERQRRRQVLLATALRPRFRRKDPHAGLQAGLTLSRRVEQWAAQLETEISRLTLELFDANRAVQDLLQRRAQAPSSELWGSGHPTVSVSLEVQAAGSSERIWFSYEVPGARWWPAYQLQLEEGRAVWTRQALVVQNTGENWEGVALQVSTADFILDRRLPRLASLRLGKAQPPHRSGFRPPPEGLDELFVRFDLYLSRSATAQRRDGTITLESPEPEMAEAAPLDVFGAAPPGPLPPPPPPPPVPPAAAPAPVKKVMASPPMPFGALRRQRADSRDMVQASAPLLEEVLEVPGPPAELDSTWLDFDRLHLAAPGEAGRGRLQPAPQGAAEAVRAERISLIENVAAPAYCVDPLISRANHDYQYEAVGLVDVPSDATPYRVSLGTGEGECRRSWRTVPGEEAQVYRQITAVNPFPTGLLPGPLEVYEGLDLLLHTQLERAGAGGDVVVGLGCEDRVRVARNVRTEEERGGLLGDQTAVLHSVDIELRNLSEREVSVEVLDRLPVSDDKHVKIKMVSCQPSSSEYGRDDQGRKVRGGMRWLVTVPAQGRALLHYEYRVQFPGRQEIEGGNRRA